MCLERAATKVERRRNFQYTKSNDGSFIGFKFFKYSKRSSCGRNFKTKRLLGEKMENGPFPVGKWIHENGWRSFPNKNSTRFYYHYERQQYTIGFHIYVREKDINMLGSFYGNVRRTVKFRNIVQTGYQQGIPIVVAKEMLILPLRKKEKKSCA